jgi:hypothetical protein
MLDDIVVKIVNSKILVQKVVHYFVIDTLDFDEQ